MMVRPLAHSDLGAVLAIERVSFVDPWSETLFEEELAREDRIWLVACEGEALLGFGGVMIVGDESHLLDFAVEPTARGRGVGRQLFWALASASVAAGGRCMTLEVRPSNTEALGLYHSAGFEIEGVRPGYYVETGEDALVLWSRPLATHVRAIGAARAGDDLVLAIETSCDETAAAVMFAGERQLSSIVASQVDFHARFGGVVPEIASRKHTEAVVAVVDAALAEAGVGFEDLHAVAVTHGPGLVGALVVGVAYAKGIALATGLPLVGVNHLEGHVHAARITDPSLEPPLVALLVSGGHTTLVHVPEWGRYEALGRTLDDAAGEAFDKVAKVLGLGYPGGPAISRLAESGDPTAIPFPRAMLRSDDFDFSLSGLKTAVIQYVDRERAAGRGLSLPDVAASFQQAVIDVQIAKTLRAAQQCGVRAVVLAGGVAANPALRAGLQTALEAHDIRLSVPPLDLCTDNAAMIAAAAHNHLADGRFLGLGADAVPNLRLG